MNALRVYRLAYACQSWAWPRGFYVARALIDLCYSWFRIVYPKGFPESMSGNPKQLMTCGCYRWDGFRCTCRLGAD